MTEARELARQMLTVKPTMYGEKQRRIVHTLAETVIAQADELERIRAELLEVTRKFHSATGRLLTSEEALEAAIAQLAVLRGALTFYAAAETYVEHTVEAQRVRLNGDDPVVARNSVRASPGCALSDIALDNGARARAALSGTDAAPTHRHEKKAWSADDNRYHAYIRFAARIRAALASKVTTQQKENNLW